MKRLNTKATRVISGVISSSLLLSSCTNGGTYLLLDDEPNTENQSTGVSISASLDEETINMLKEITPLVNDILADKEVAKEFAKDPYAFCENNYGFSFDLSDPVLNLLLALGDEALNETLENGDIDRFLDLCIEKGFINENQEVEIGITLNNEQDQEMQEILSLLGVKAGVVETRSVALWAVVSVVVVIAIIITYTVGAAQAQKIVENTINPNLSILNLYALKGDNSKSYQLVSKYKERLTNNIIKTLEKRDPDVFTKFTEQQISEFIKSNMIV